MSAIAVRSRSMEDPIPSEEEGVAPARIGKLRLSLEYVVDLDDPAMVRMALRHCVEDLFAAIRGGTLDRFIAKVETDGLTEDDLSFPRSMTTPFSHHNRRGIRG